MLSPNQARIQSFRVVPYLPEPLRPLVEIAHNLWWTWNYEAVSLFTRLDRDLWEQCHHNPVLMLGTITQDKLDRAAHDRSYLHALGTVHSQMVEHMQHRGWFGEAGAKLAPADKPFKVAYFCAEFGLTECFQIYSGGLGGLAGDHLKSAAELSIPLVAVGLLYRRGYFHQYLNPDGYQQETYPDIDAPNQPIQRVIDPATGRQRRVTVELPGRSVGLGIWRCDVGRVPLYLLDANLPENSREDREITANLYGGDIEQRIRQEIVLGVGGARALEAVGENPSVYHINEGHAAFLSLERISTARRGTNLSFDQAREAVAAGQIFTTHTPVPAGIDRFPPRMIETYLSHMLPDLGLDLEGLLALGRENTADRKEFFSMAVLAIRTSRFCNGVSRLHGDVSREMWKQMWPGTPQADVPIGHVTNGVHTRSWASGDITQLFDRYMGQSWHESPQDEGVWAAVDEIPDEELWAARQRRREHLIAWVRKQIRRQLTARGAGSKEIEAAAAALDTNALTIGFARRFATYKRGTLLFRDKQRLDKLLNSDRPVQLLIAGKAHPADGGGKALIREIVEFTRQGRHNLRVVFLEDYDLNVARRLVQGCDVWLNTPVRGLEASGTSGMKAALNGGINLSILDGWWDEAFDPEVGFAIGRGEAYAESNRDEQDDIESRSLYQVLESQVLPEFYDRDEGGIPRRWVARMKRCIRALAPQFSTHRMLVDYATKFYFPAHAAAARLRRDNLAQARELADHLDHLRRMWHEVRVADVTGAVPTKGAITVRGQVPVRAKVALGSLAPRDVQVQLYHGQVTSLGELVNAEAIVMRHERDEGDGTHLFTGSFVPQHSGQHGYSVRVLPADERLVTPFVPGLITWDNGPPADEIVGSLQPASAAGQAVGVGGTGSGGGVTARPA
ncbi:MAG: alpha-glucan family phosphorylase [Phycisphaerae bacterium]|nr:alpha-glucan family phosphorylase [Phycisphaerae bacterium]